MGQNENPKVIRLEGVNYIGSVLDAFNYYLDFKVNTYFLQSANWREARRGFMQSGRGGKITVRKLGEFYLIDGFPKDRDWLEFKSQARGLVNGIDGIWFRKIIIEEEKKYWEEQKRKQKKNGKV
jgi:hypothetical protein